MTTLSLPTGWPEPAKAEFWLSYNTQQHESPLSRDVQTLELAGGRWRAEFTFAPMFPEVWRVVNPFIARLRGGAGRVYMPVPYPMRTPRGTAGGTPLVAGGSQTGSSLTTDGWSAGATLLAGDYFHFTNGAGGRELKIVRTDATADGSGAMTITFDPPIRSAPADNAALTTSSPSCIMGLADDDQGRIAYEEGRAAIGNMSLSLIERFL